jgi:hypothetical protein
MGMDSFAPFLKINGCFIVMNICKQIGKTIRIFNYPIRYGHTRDLLAIPGVAEGDIRSSLLKGELQHKILYEDIVVICSDVDLLQFNEAQLAFLQGAGIVNGLTIPSGNANYLLRQRQPLIGAIDGVNRTFKVPSPDKFLEGTYDSNIFHIYVTLNGQLQVLGTNPTNGNFTISESGGVGSGYDTVNLYQTPLPGRSILEASYVIATI